MLTNYHIYCDGEHAEFFVHNKVETFLEKLECVLYLLWDLTPTDREYSEHWKNNKTFRVDYHNMEHYNVFMSIDNKIYVVKA